jgi:TolA-binding protein
MVRFIVRCLPTGKHLTKLIIIFILIFTPLFTAFAQTKNSELYAKAVALDNKHKYSEAIKVYRQYINAAAECGENFQEDKIRLRIARITEDFAQAASEYKTFIEKCPKSRYRFLARYELATLYKLKGHYSEALTEFYELSYRCKGTPYWQKSLLEATEIEIELYNFEKAIINLYNLLEEIEDYEDIGRTYFLLGVANVKQKCFDDAEEYFLICAGSFPMCSAAASSLLELIAIHIQAGRIAYAKKIQSMLEDMYPDSPQIYEAPKLLAAYKDVTADDGFIEIELNMEDNQKIRQRTLARLREDFHLSNDEFVGKTNDSKINQYESLKFGTYLQLGYYSDPKYAQEYIEECDKKGIKGLFLSETTSSKSNQKFYRILLGPFSQKAANEKLIELKDSHIEAISMELTINYE